MDRIKSWLPYVPAAAVGLLQAGLQLSGYTNMPLAIALWALAVTLLILAAWHSVREKGWQFQWPVVRKAIPSTTLRRPVSDQELDYRVQQRKFVLSDLGEMYTAWLHVITDICDKCSQTGDALAVQLCWFVDYGLHHGIRRQYGALKSAAERDFAGTLTAKVNEDILRFLQEYDTAATFPKKIEVAAGLGKTSRDKWDTAHQRCRAALLNLKASVFSGVLSAEDTAMNTMQVPPSKR